MAGAGDDTGFDAATGAGACAAACAGVGLTAAIEVTLALLDAEEEEVAFEAMAEFVKAVTTVDVIVDERWLTSGATGLRRWREDSKD